MSVCDFIIELNRLRKSSSESIDSTSKFDEFKEYNGFSLEDNTVGDINGIDLNRQTITGENDALFKALIEMNEQRHIYEDEYFPNVVKQYIDYGAVLLEQEYRYGHDFYAHLVNLEKGI